MQKLLRRLLHRLSRGLVFQRALRADGVVVPLYVAPEAQLKYLKLGLQAEDRELMRMARRHVTEKSVVWDVGANVGVFSFASAVRAGKGTVVAIEADIWLAGLLNRTRRLPAYADRDVRIIPTAVADRCGVMSFLIAEGGRASNALEAAGGRSQMGGARMRLQVPTLTLDTLLESQPSPDFVKIDIEGAEWMALRGADRLVDEVRPVFYIEVGDNTAAEVYARFARAGYLAIDPANCERVDACVANTYFLPREKEGKLEELRRALISDS